MENNINLDELLTCGFGLPTLLIGDYSICQYSGLPSVSSYVMEEENNDFFAGHS
jgi:hypothetical protein